MEEEQTNTVFVGSIAPDTDDRALREFFNQFGRVLETKVVLLKNPVKHSFQCTAPAEPVFPLQLTAGLLKLCLL